ncbi:MAG: CBS domain-containing protein [Coleofasciculaceae cyanobacterium]
MQSETTPIPLLDLKDLIDTEILTTSPDATLADIITLMSQVRKTCSLFNSRAISVENIGHSVQQKKIQAGNINITNSVPASCILVLEETCLLGILTAQDLVHLQAEKIKLKQTRIAEVMKPIMATLTLSQECNLFQVLWLFRQHQISYLPVLDSNNQILGIITPESILRGLPPLDPLKSKPVSAVMTSPLPQATVESSITDVFQMLLANQSPYVVLTQGDVNQDLLPLGLITERDLIQSIQLSLSGLDLSKTQAQMLLRLPQFCLSPGDSLWKAQQQMLHLGQVEPLLVVCTGQETEARGETQPNHLGVLTAANLLPELELALCASLTPREMLGVVETFQQTIKQQKKLLEQVKEELKGQRIQHQQTEKTLLESEEKLRSLVTNIPGAIYRGICNDSWMMEFISDGITEISGYCSSDFTHNQVRKFESIIHPQDRKMVEREIQKAIIERRPYEIEYRLIRADGNIRWVCEVGRSTFSQDEDIIWLDGAIFDITKRRNDKC